MAEPRALVLSLVERGWQAARECSLDAACEQTAFLHAVKGSLDQSLRGLIAPRPHIRCISVPRWVFWPWVWRAVIWLRLTAGLRAILVDNDRSYRRLTRWARWSGVRLAQVMLGPQGYELREGHHAVSRGAWRAALMERSRLGAEAR